MIIRVTHGGSGLAEYLEDGIKQERDQTRDELDIRVPLHGDLQTFKSATDYLCKNKKYKSNYLHITASFSIEDNDIDDEKLEEITREILDYYCAGYDIDNDVISYAEAHKPKFQHIEDKKNGGYEQRLLHIHLGISRRHVKTDKQLWIAPFSFKSDSAFQNYINQKYDLTNPQDNKRKQVITKKDMLARVDGKEPTRQSIISKVRKELSNVLKDENSLDDVIQLLNEIDFIDEVVFKDMSHQKSGNKYLQIKLKEVGVKKINLRGKGFENLEKLYYSSNEYQQRIEDKKINLSERSMEENLRIVNQRKEWATRQVKKRFKKSKQIDYKNIEQRLLSSKPKVFKFKEQRVFMNNPITELLNDVNDRKAVEKLSSERINDIKNNLPAVAVLQFAVNEYGILAEYYKIIDNKIKDTRRRTKPRNVVDFLTKDCNLKLSEALPLLNDFYEQWMKKQSKFNKKLSPVINAIIVVQDDKFFDYRKQLLDKIYRGSQRDYLINELAELVKFVDISIPEKIEVTTKAGGKVVDTGDKLTGFKGMNDEISVMVAMAEIKGWSSVEVNGSDDFKRRAYLALKESNIEVINYEPSIKIEPVINPVRGMEI